MSSESQFHSTRLKIWRARRVSRVAGNAGGTSARPQSKMAVYLSRRKLESHVRSPVFRLTQ